MTLPALLAVLPRDVAVEVADAEGSDVVVLAAGQRLRIRRLTAGWPKQLREALRVPPRPDAVVAPELSPGARRLARTEGIGWFDGTGAAEIAVGTLVVSRSGRRLRPTGVSLGWRRSHLVVCEALITGCSPTVDAVVRATGLAMSTAGESLRFLQEQEVLSGTADRGRDSGRTVTDPEALLELYAAAASRLRGLVVMAVGALWRDPVRGAARAGHAWDAVGLPWAATGALAAAALAPLQTQVSPVEIYVGHSYADLRRAANAADLVTMEGGRLLLRPFPQAKEPNLVTEHPSGLKVVPWPRVYADLRITGVRGEEAADHLHEEMTRDRG